MSFQDKTLECKDPLHDENTRDSQTGEAATREFIFTTAEQEFYQQKGFDNEPTRCEACRRAKKARFNDGPRQQQQGGSRQMFSAICGNCGKTAEVPFEPRGDKPVYCAECFQTMRDQRPARY